MKSRRIVSRCRSSLLNCLSINNVDGGMTKRREDIDTILTTHVSWWRIIADGIPSWHTWPNVHRLTKLGCATNRIGTKPNHLREMTPLFKGGQIWVVLTIVRRKVGGLFSVVPHVCSSDSHLLVSTKGLSIGGTVCSNVLSISTAINVHAVTPLACCSKNLSGCNKLCVPLQERNGVIGAMDIVVIQRSRNIVCGSRSWDWCQCGGRVDGSGDMKDGCCNCLPIGIIDDFGDIVGLDDLALDAIEKLSDWGCCYHQGK